MKHRRRLQFELFLVSFLSLFLEVLFIRWAPAEIKVLGYFTNFVLIAAVFGLGLGCLMADSKKNSMVLLPPYFLVLGLIIFAFKTVLVAGATGDLLLLSGEGDVPVINLYLALAFFYLVISIFFIPFGQITGRLFNLLPPLQAYSINIVGNIIGVISFFFLSNYTVPSYVWFIITSIALIYFLPKNKLAFALSFSCLAVLSGLVFFMSLDSIWSPYNKITTSPIKEQKTPPRIFLPFEAIDNPEMVTNLPNDVGMNVCIGNVFYQYILDLSDKNILKRPYLKKFQNQYNYPYRIAPNLNEVLIVGAGTGNDVAGALRMGAKRIDAVEIDPMLVDLGRKSHPEKPYTNPRVSVHIDDARSFMKKTGKKYDLVVFGLLDSHQIFSSMSSARLDSYVYTTECFREVKNLLKENGIVLVSFAIGTRILTKRMYGMLSESFENVGLSRPNKYHPIGVQFLGANSHFPELPKDDRYVGLFLNQRQKVPVSTDDWPFFYVDEKAIPFEYLMFILLAALISLSMVFPIIRGKKWDLHFFFLGSAFMLLETKSITSMALLFGSTWIVSSIVIACVLLMILLSNFTVIYLKPRRQHIFYALLFGSLVISYFFPIDLFLTLSFWPKLIYSSFFFSVPIFLAGCIFAISFKSAKHVNLALAFNLIGLVAGGLAEYCVLVTGFRYLFIMAISMYFASYVFLLGRKGD